MLMSIFDGVISWQFANVAQCLTAMRAYCGRTGRMAAVSFLLRLSAVFFRFLAGFVRVLFKLRFDGVKALPGAGMQKTKISDFLKAFGKHML